jgi:hypothetical protein
MNAWLRLLACSAALALPALSVAQKLTTPIDVTVVNPITRPVPTVDRSAAQPVTGYCQAGILNPTRCTLYTVPSGKRLVVETVSYFMTMELNAQPQRLSFGKRYDEPLVIAPGLFPVTPVLLYTDATVRRYAGSQALRFYLDQGEALGAEFYGSGPNNYVQEAAFSGYLVDR